MVTAETALANRGGHRGWHGLDHESRGNAESRNLGETKTQATLRVRAAGSQESLFGVLL